MEEFITNDFVQIVLSWILGVVIGITIITKTSIKQDKRLLNNLLELEDNLARYKTEVQNLRDRYNNKHIVKTRLEEIYNRKRG